MILSLLPDRFAVCRLEPAAPLPEWAWSGSLTSISRTPDELSVVCAEENVPADVPAERGWRCVKVEGPLAFGLTGVLASLTLPLADAGVPAFALSTYGTDYLLVPEARIEHALGALRGVGHTTREE